MSDTSADATSGTEATSAQQGQSTGAAGANSGSDEPLGDAGKRALEAERQARRDAEDRLKAAADELEKLRTASQSDHEKAINEARKEAETATAEKYRGQIRQLQLQNALRDAGISDAKSLELSAAAPLFRDLKVRDDGTVDGLEGAVEQAKKDYPALFEQRTGSGVTRGVQRESVPDPKTPQDRLARAYAASSK